jgi:hypothetical protein
MLREVDGLARRAVVAQVRGRCDEHVRAEGERAPNQVRIGERGKVVAQPDVEALSHEVDEAIGGLQARGRSSRGSVTK